jgi:UDP-N-acetylglucosamine 4,6-dehydratase/5-epimerase
MKKIELEKYKKHFAGKTILITGGTGSFGSAVVKKLLDDFDPKKIVIFSRDEKKQFDMGNHFNSKKLSFVIGDVRDRERVDYAMKNVDLVFHAAALKQVPSCEFFPVEAIKTNSLGAYNIIAAAIDNDVEKVVVLSTDKAVYPINAMGMTKALMERIMIAMSREKKSKTVLCGTRYGNVMYTRGSVIPLFVDLIKKGKPLQLTNGKMTRFMMSLDQSIDLVFYALAHGKNGEIYVRKAPASTVEELAKALASLFSYKGKIEEMGVRPGEKKHESLISQEELYRTEDCGDYYKINPEVPEMDYRSYYFKGTRVSSLPKEGYTSENTKRLSVEEIEKLLLSLDEIKEELKKK